jgi:hypothetical protein
MNTVIDRRGPAPPRPPPMCRPIEHRRAARRIRRRVRRSLCRCVRAMVMHQCVCVCAHLGLVHNALASLTSWVEPGRLSRERPANVQDARARGTGLNSFNPCAAAGSFHSAGSLARAASAYPSIPPPCKCLAIATNGSSTAAPSSAETSKYSMFILAAICCPC